MVSNSEQSPIVCLVFTASSKGGATDEGDQLETSIKDSMEDNHSLRDNKVGRLFDGWMTWICTCN